MESVITSLLASTYTTARLTHRLGVLQHVLERLVYTPDPLQERAQQYEAELVAYAEPADVTVLTALGTDWLSRIDESTLHTELAAARARIEAVPTFIVYVPTVFDEAAEVHLGTWCRAKVRPELLLELEVDPRVIGGCGFIASTHYSEQSLRTRLAADPSIIPTIIATYEQ